MKIIRILSFALLGLMLGASGAVAQLRLPGTSQQKAVTWNTKAVAADSGYIDLVLTASIASEWHMYSMSLPEGGPNPTTFTFTESPDYQLVGKPTEAGNAVTEHDESFNLDLTSFSGNAVFTQRILPRSGAAFTVSVLAEYQTCFATRCEVNEDDLQVAVPAELAASQIALLGDRAVAAASNSTPAPDGGTLTPGDAVSAQVGGEAGQPIAVFIIISFLAGLAGLLTPCVFPMIPMTVSFFLGKKGRMNALINALVFGVSIVAIYTLLGLLVSLAGLGADFITDVTTHWITNLVFFLLFAVFAAAFFGMFEIRLPSSLSSKTDAKVDKGGYIGSFFFALTTVIVSLSCVGPIVGALLIEGASGAAVRPVLGMLFFSLGFSIPFTLFAIFPSWLNKLPKSGGWMNSVKIVLGFIVLAFSMKFLLGFDSSLGLNLLSRSIYLSVWIVLAFFLGLYLIGHLRFKMDSPMSHVGFLRMLLALAAFAFGIYLIPGLFGAKLYGLSGFLPVAGDDDFTISAPAATGLPQSATTVTTLCDTPKYADFIKMPAGLEGYRDYQQALACAQQRNMPVLVEFTGHGCANCKVMAAQMLSRPEVAGYLMQNFIVAALYVDDKYELPEAEWYTSPADGKVKKTIGKQNIDLEARTFNVSGQPLFFVVSPKGEILVGPLGLETDPKAFIAFLDSGLEKFKQLAQ